MTQTHPLTCAWAAQMAAEVEDVFSVGTALSSAAQVHFHVDRAAKVGPQACLPTQASADLRMGQVDWAVSTTPTMLQSLQLDHYSLVHPSCSRTSAYQSSSVQRLLCARTKARQVSPAALAYSLSLGNIHLLHPCVL